LWLFGGVAGGRCLQDLWQYNFITNEWELLNFSKIEKSVNEQPSRRKKASILSVLNEIFIFGGETDVFLTGENVGESNAFIPLNDIWSFNLTNKSFENYDPNRILPRRIGNIIYADNNIIKILIKQGKDDLGNFQPNRIWIVDRNTNDVTYIDYTPPFPIMANNISLYINGNFYIISQNKLYKFDNSTNTFTLVKDPCNAIYFDEKYITNEIITKNYGDNSNMNTSEIIKIYIKNTDDSNYKTLDINLPPKGYNLNKINFENKIFYYSGLITYSQFDEDTYIFDGNSHFTQKFTFPEDQRPTERFYTSLCYDKYRNRIWLFGGFDGSKFYNDLWYFDLNTNEWVKVHDQLENTNEENPIYPAPRQKAGIAVVAEDYLYIIGGYSDVKSFDDFWKFHIPTNRWEREYTLDGIPWGTEYFIFEWKDRLWFFNGDISKLYRYYYNKKQFVPQKTLWGYVSDGLKNKIINKEFLNPPIKIYKIEDQLFIWAENLNIKIDLNSREILDLTREFNLKNNIEWVKRFYGIDKETLNSYFVNISSTFPLTKNQHPMGTYSFDLIDPELGITNEETGEEESIKVPAQTGFFAIYDVGSDTKKVYIDKSGLFTIQAEKEYLDKAELLVDGTIYPALLQSQYPDKDLNDENTLTEILMEKVRQPWFVPQRPWFLYNKHSTMYQELNGLRDIKQDEKYRNIYYLIYLNGNIVRLNLTDDTFYTYFTKIWPGSSIAYYKNKIYVFGGVKNTRPAYDQVGFKNESFTHNGFLKIDLDLYQLNINKFTNYLKENNITRIDINEARDYILDNIRDYLDYYGGKTDQIHPETLEYIKQKVYLQVQTILDDMSQLDVLYENGIRPSSRAYHQFFQKDNEFYIISGGLLSKKSCEEMMGSGGGEGKKIVLPFDIKCVDNKIYKYEMDSETWSEIGDFPSKLYMGSAILSPDKTFAIIVGGYTNDHWENITNKIWIYRLDTNTIEEFKGIDEKFSPRAMPILHWIDEHRLLIAFGFITYKTQGKCEGGMGSCEIVHFLPLLDMWILDIQNEIMYQTYKGFLPFGILVHDFYNIKNTKYSYLLNPYPIIKGIKNDKLKFDTNIKLIEMNNINGSIKTININPSSEIASDFDIINKIKMAEDSGNNDPFKSSSKCEDSSLNKDLTYFLNGEIIENSNFRFRYAWIENFKGYKTLFVVGERREKSNIPFIDLMTRDDVESHLRIWYCNLDEEFKVLYDLKVEYPLPKSPKFIAYDGKKYLYVYWNKYNIWRLNFKKLIENPDQNLWDRLPPNPTLTSLDEEKYLKGKIIDNKYLFVYDNKGKLFKMDIDTFVWFSDRTNEMTKPFTSNVTGKEQIIIDDNNELYKIWIGNIGGKYYNIYYKQCDNFFFDLRYFEKVITDYHSIIFEMSLWPCYIRRHRLYIMNHLGHLFYSWIRIDGTFDIEYQMEEFYNAEKIKIFTDDYGLSQKDRFKVKVFSLTHGWIDIPSSAYNVVIEDPDWYWDGEYLRRYKKQIILPDGSFAYQYTKAPPNYVEIPISSFTGGEPISKFRIFFKPEPKEYNYIVHINNVEAYDLVKEINTYESPYSGPINIIHLEPLHTNETEGREYIVYIKNDSSKTINNIRTFIYDNSTKKRWLLFSLDRENWKFGSPNDPLEITRELNPGQITFFYVKPLNIDDNPKKTDLVVIGYEPL